jgi:hypothetical protein
VLQVVDRIHDQRVRARARIIIIMIAFVFSFVFSFAFVFVLGRLAATGCDWLRLVASGSVSLIPFARLVVFGDLAVDLLGVDIKHDLFPAMKVLGLFFSYAVA